MKDILENRQRIRFGRKLRIARPALQENGLLWCLLFFTYYVDRHMSELCRMLRSGGVGGAEGGWRSNVTREVFEQAVARRGLRKTRSLTYWVRP